MCAAPPLPEVEQLKKIERSYSVISDEPDNDAPPPPLVALLSRITLSPLHLARARVVEMHATACKTGEVQKYASVRRKHNECLRRDDCATSFVCSVLPHFGVPEHESGIGACD